MSELNLMCRTPNQCSLGIREFLGGVRKHISEPGKLGHEGFSDKVTYEQRSEENKGTSPVVFLQKKWHMQGPEAGLCLPQSRKS